MPTLADLLRQSDEWVDKTLTFDPTEKRMILLPRPRGSLPSEGRGSVMGKGIDWTDWIAPDALVSLVEAFKMPGRAMRGEELGPEHAVQFATNLIGGSSIAPGLPSGSLAANKIGGKTLREILYGDKPNLTAAEKSAITRYEKELQNPAVLRREKMRLSELGDVVTPTPGTTFVPEIGIKPESLVGKQLVPVMSDLSIAGGTVSQIAGVPLSRPVVQQGGRLYSQIEPNVQQGVGWASEPAAAASKTANLNKWSDEDTLGVFLGMGPQSINFSHHMAEGMVGQLSAIKPSREAIRELNQTIRNAPVINPETKETSFPFKSFAGVDSPNIYEIMANDGQLRKAIVEKMSMAKFRNMGFPRWEDTAAVMTEPGLKQGYAGQTMFQATPGGMVLKPIYEHGSYSAGIPGQYMGGLLNAEGKIVGAPAELLWPKTYERMRAAGKKEAQIARSMQMSHHGEKFTEQALDPLMRFLGYE